MLLLEIAYWRLATQFDEMKSQPLNSWDVKERLLSRTAKDIAHMMDQSYAIAVESCLNFDELTKDLNEYDTYKVFESKVLSVLKRATTTS